MFHFEFDNRRHIPRSCQWHCMFDNYSRYTQLQGRATGRAGDNHAQQSHDVTIVSFFWWCQDLDVSQIDWWYISAWKYWRFGALSLEMIVQILPTTFSNTIFNSNHYSDVITGTMASQITSPTIVYSNVYSGADKRKHQSSVSLAFV